MKTHQEKSTIVVINIITIEQKNLEQKKLEQKKLEQKASLFDVIKVTVLPLVHTLVLNLPLLAKLTSLALRLWE